MIADSKHRIADSKYRIAKGESWVFTIRYPLFAIRYLSFAICYPLFAICYLLFAMPVAAQLDIRHITQTNDVRDAQIKRRPIKWYQGESIIYEASTVRGTNVVPLLDADIAAWYVTERTWTNITVWILSTGSVSNATARFEVPPGKSNLPEGEYDSHVRLYDLDGGQTNFVGTIARGKAICLWSPDAGGYDIATPIVFPPTEIDLSGLITSNDLTNLVTYGDLDAALSNQLDSADVSNIVVEIIGSISNLNITLTNLTADAEIDFYVVFRLVETRQEYERSLALGMEVEILDVSILNDDPIAFDSTNYFDLSLLNGTNQVATYSAASSALPAFTGFAMAVQSNRNVYASDRIVFQKRNTGGFAVMPDCTATLHLKKRIPIVVNTDLSDMVSTSQLYSAMADFVTSNDLAQAVAGLVDTNDLQDAVSGLASTTLVESVRSVLIGLINAVSNAIPAPHDPVTSGGENYAIQTGQHFAFEKIDLGNHVSGILPTNHIHPDALKDRTVESNGSKISGGHLDMGTYDLTLENGESGLRHAVNELEVGDVYNRGSFVKLSAANDQSSITMQDTLGGIVLQSDGDIAIWSDFISVSGAFWLESWLLDEAGSFGSPWTQTLVPTPTGTRWADFVTPQALSNAIAQVIDRYLGNNTNHYAGGPIYMGTNILYFGTGTTAIADNNLGMRVGDLMNQGKRLTLIGSGRVIDLGDVVTISELGPMETELINRINTVSNAIPDVTPFSTKGELGVVETNLLNLIASTSNAIPDVSPFATTNQLNAVSNAIPDVTPFSTKSELGVVETNLLNLITSTSNAIPDVSPFATTAQVAGGLSNLQTQIDAISFTNTDAQTLSLSNNVLSINHGNSVTNPIPRIAQVFVDTQQTITPGILINFGTTGRFDAAYFRRTASSIVVNQPGWYQVRYEVSSEGQNSRSTSEYEFRVNGVFQPGSRSWIYHRFNSQNRGTASRSIWLLLDTDDAVQVAGKRLSGFSQIKTIPHGCSLTLEGYLP